MYAVYHGPEGLRRIARRVHDLTCRLAEGLEQLGYGLAHEDFFDTIRMDLGKRSSGEFLRRALQRTATCVSSGPTASEFRSTKRPRLATSRVLLDIFGENRIVLPGAASANRKSQIANRKSDFLTHPVFNTHDSETEMLRYMRRLEARDLSLCHSHDPARLVHDEVERDRGDVSDFVAGVRAASSLCA